MPFSEFSIEPAPAPDDTGYVRRSFVDQARADATDCHAFVRDSRDKAVSLAVGVAPASVEIAIDGGVFDLGLEYETMLGELAVIYMTKGWAGVQAVVRTVEAECERQLRPQPADADVYGVRAADLALENQTADRSGYPRTFDVAGLPGALQSLDPAVERSRLDLWQRAKSAFESAAELLRMNVIAAFDRIDQRAAEFAMARLNHARDLAADVWVRYGVHRSDPVPSHGVIQTRAMYSYSLSNEGERKSLKGVMELLVNTIAELEDLERIEFNATGAEGGSGSGGPPPYGSLPALREKIRKKQEELDAVLAAARARHPVATVLLIMLKPGFDDDALAARTYEVCHQIIAAAEDPKAVQPSA
jgi:hypothetical protein